MFNSHSDAWNALLLARGGIYLSATKRRQFLPAQLLGAVSAVPLLSALVAIHYGAHEGGHLGRGVVGAMAELVTR